MKRLLRGVQYPSLEFFGSLKKNGFSVTVTSQRYQLLLRNFEQQLRAVGVDTPYTITIR